MERQQFRYLNAAFRNKFSFLIRLAAESHPGKPPNLLEYFPLIANPQSAGSWIMTPLRKPSLNLATLACLTDSPRDDNSQRAGDPPVGITAYESPVVIHPRGTTAVKSKDLVSATIFKPLS